MNGFMHQKILIFTDLDGSLLDHHSYSYSAAGPLLEDLRTADVPVIPVTSKTRAELQVLRTELQNRHPFIVENGAAVFMPKACFPELVGNVDTVDDLFCYTFSESRAYWQALLKELEAEFEHLFTTFEQAGVEGIMAMTGLSRAAAERANQRDFSEPVSWLGDEKSKQSFIAAVEARGATVLQGGRFLHITGGCDKGKAVQWLCQQYQDHYAGLDLLTLAAGDSHNDIAMLEVVDKPIIIRSPVQGIPALKHHDVYITNKYGPEGWVEAVSKLIAPTISCPPSNNSLLGND